MESFLRRHSNVLTLTALLVVQVLGLAVQVKGTSESGASSNLLHLWAIRLIAPIEKGFVHSGNSARNVWQNYFYLRTVRHENEQLKQQIEQMRIQNVRLQEDAMQARRIQSLLGFKEQFISKTIAAQVIGTSGTDLSRLIYIDRGSDDGIKPDMAVITPEGVVGKILRVQSSTSQVLEISDQTSGVGAILVNLRLQGIVKGTAGGDIVLNNIMQNEKVEVGDPITTSGGDRIFPKGLPIGTVASTFPGRDVFLNIRLKPAANLNRLEEVLVITEIKNQEPDTKDLGPIRAADILAQRLPSVPQQTNPAPGTAAPGATPNSATQTVVAPPANSTSTTPPKASGNSPTVPGTNKPPSPSQTTVPSTKPKSASQGASNNSTSPSTDAPNTASPKTTVPKASTPKSATPKSANPANPLPATPRKDSTSTTPPPQGQRP
jgi:rod shape-determining protein MreC